MVITSKKMEEIDYTKVSNIEEVINRKKTENKN